jgi:hypothetical protein
LLVGLLVALTGASLSLQPASAITTMTITGIVTDQAGTPIPGVFVTDQFQDVYTNAVGRYMLEEQTPAPRVLTLAKTGFESPAARRVSPLDAQSDVNFALDYRLGPSVTPFVLNVVPRTVDLSMKSFAPTASCATWTDTYAGAVAELALTATAPDGERTWTGTFNVPAGTLEGGHPGVAIIRRCSDGAALTKPKSAGYIVDLTGPSIADITPANWSSDSTPTISARALDPVSGVASATFTVDGLQVASARGDFGTWSAAAGPLADGPHEIVFSATDYGSNTTTERATFKIDTVAPVTSDQSPTGAVATRSPLIQVRIADATSGPDGQRTHLSLSRGPLSETLAANFDAATGILSYQVPTTVTGTGLGDGPLLDGTYDVEAAALDQAGNSVTLHWQFEVRCLTAPLACTPA